MIDSDTRAQPLESYVAAATLALSEMAGTLITVREVHRGTLDQTRNNISALVELSSATEKILLLSFPVATATVLTGRVLKDAKVELHENLICDCLGEIANVVAGQAKTLLAGTPHQMTFSLPTVLAGSLPQFKLEHARECLLIAFESDAGDFLLGLAPHR